jgi:hypothetical protein
MSKVDWVVFTIIGLSMASGAWLTIDHHYQQRLREVRAQRDEALSLVGYSNANTLTALAAFKAMRTAHEAQNAKLSACYKDIGAARFKAAMGGMAR